MKILAMDISTTATGYAVYENETYLESGVLKCKGRYAKDRYYGLCLEIEKMFDKVGHVDLVVAEDTFYRRNFKDTKYIIKLHGHVEYLANRIGAKFDTIVTSTWRGILGFPTNFLKTPSVVYKGLSIERAAELTGSEPADDNEADAVCIGFAYPQKSSYVPKSKRKKSCKKVANKKRGD